MIKYRGVNKWMVYNLQTRKFYILPFVWFDEDFSYYNTSHKAENEDNENTKLGTLWNEINDNKFDKIMAGK